MESLPPVGGNQATHASRLSRPDSGAQPMRQAMEPQMLKRYQRTIGDLFRIFDAIIVVAAWLASYWLRFKLWPVPAHERPSFESCAALSPLVAVLWAATFSWRRVYESRRLVGRAQEMVMMLRAHGFALLVFIAITYAFEDYKFSRGVMGIFAATAAVALVVTRGLVRTALRNVRARGYNLRHVLAVGEGPALEHLVQRIGRYPELGLQVLGVVTPDGSTVTEVLQKPVVGHYGRVAEVVSAYHVDEVIVALGASEASILDNILDALKDEPVALRLVPDVQRFIALGCEVEDFDGVPVVRLNDSPLVGSAAAAKRLTDVMVAAVALMLLAPLMAVIALAVRLTSKGPVLYGQERMGLDGHTFLMYKFRSMKVDAERESGAVWARQTDDRRTPIGTFLRKTSLDELPQFWHVLMGDMSLVGPRPERPVFVQKFRHQIPHYMLRHKVKAGITGWAQVNGWRGDTSLSARIECDLFYIKNWSYLLDLRILVMTLWKGFVHKNAY
jgi:Undecaprenyl-phosphate glucose phosphotransferase